MTDTDNLNLKELQRLMLADPENDEVRQEFRRRMSIWMHLEDCLMEEL